MTTLRTEPSDLGPRPRACPYRLNQYDIFTRKVLSGWSPKSSRKSSRTLPCPNWFKYSCRPCAHTRKIVEPGRYSHRNTEFDRNCLNVKPPGFAATAGSAYGLKRSSYAAARGSSNSRTFEKRPLLMYGWAYTCSERLGVAV